MPKSSCDYTVCNCQPFHSELSAAPLSLLQAQKNHVVSNMQLLVMFGICSVACPPVIYALCDMYDVFLLCDVYPHAGVCVCSAVISWCQ